MPRKKKPAAAGGGGEIYFASRGGRGLTQEMVQQVGEWIDAHEEVSKRKFFEAAKPADSKFHGLFCWNDKVMAEQARLARAGDILRTVMVERVIGGEKTHIRAAISIPFEPDDPDDEDAGSERRYVCIRKVEEDPNLQRLRIEDGIKRLRWWWLDYKKYSAHFGMVPKAVTALLRNIASKKRKKGKGKP